MRAQFLWTADPESWLLRSRRLRVSPELPVPPAAQLRPGAARMTVGVLGPQLEVSRIRMMIDADWRVIGLWGMDPSGQLHASCDAIVVSPGTARPGRIDHLLSTLRKSESPTPPVLVRAGAITSPPPWVQLFDGEWRPHPLQERLLDLVFSPFFSFLASQIQLAMDSHPILATLMADLIRRQPPSFSQAIALERSGFPAYVRHVKDVELVSYHSRSHLSTLAARAGVPLGEFMTKNAVLHALARWIPGFRFRYRLARRLNYQAGDSLEKAVRRVSGLKLSEAKHLALGDLSVRLLGSDFQLAHDPFRGERSRDYDKS